MKVGTEGPVGTALASIFIDTLIILPVNGIKEVKTLVTAQQFGISLGTEGLIPGPSSPVVAYGRWWEQGLH